MPLTSLKHRISDIRRFRQVTAVLFDEGLHFFVDKMKLHYLLPTSERIKRFFLRRVGREEIIGDYVDPPLEVRLRRAFERLGPTFVKFGQLLSMRTDIIPDAFVKEFSKLQDNVGHLRPGVAEKIVESELGVSIENIFSSFDTEPLAAASLAQVHRATLKDGTVVAVKVKRPGVDSIVKKDVHIVAYLAHMLEKYVPESLRFRPARVAREFSFWTLQELDFEIEAANIDRFRTNFLEDNWVVIPHVYWDYTTKSILVTELIDGVKVDDLEALEKAGIDRKDLAHVGLLLGLKQYFVNGFFHGDPHPGNMVALPPAESPFEKTDQKPMPRLSVYDFGIVGSLSEKERFELVSCITAFVNKDMDAFAGHMLDLAEIGDGADEAAFRHEAGNILTGVLYKPTDRKGVAFAFYHILLKGAQYGIYFPTDLVLLGKAFLTLENMGLNLYPEIDLDEELRPFIAEVVKRELDPSKIARDAAASAFDNILFAKQLPAKTRALIEHLEKGEVGVRIDLDELHDLKSEFDRQNDVRVLAVLTAALLLGSAFVMRLDERIELFGLSLGQIGFTVAIVVVLWLFVLIRKRPDA